MLVFRDYLPHIVGDVAMSRLLGRYPGYDPNVDPSIANVFATAAYRFAHLAIQPFLARLDQNYRENARIPNVPLFKAFFTPWRIVFEGERRGHKVLARNMNLERGRFLHCCWFVIGGIDPLIRGLAGRPAKLNAKKPVLVNALRERLFQFVMHLALDLGSLNMQRGRDHAIPGTYPLKASPPLVCFLFARVIQLTFIQFMTLQRLCDLMEIHLFYSTR